MDVIYNSTSKNIGMEDLINQKTLEGSTTAVDQ
jgi:hypothetical protein